MEDSQVENSKGKGKSPGTYKLWTMEESNMLLQLMVDGINRGWRDASGVLGKQTVEQKILPILNAKLGCQKNYSHYLSRLKWYKQKYANYSELMRFSSGFGWDQVTKQFTASNEVWEDYLKAHPNGKKFRTETFTDYEDLRIVVGNGTAVGKSSIGLGDSTDARTYTIENLIFDTQSGTFVQNEDELPQQMESHELSPNPSPVLVHSTDMRASSKTATKRKRSRNFDEGNSNSQRNVETEFFDKSVFDSIISGCDEIRNLLEKREKESDCWDAIKETPGLDNYAQNAEIVLACVRLHNFLRKECRSDEFPIEPDDEEVLSESAEEENYDEQILQSQEQQRELANEWRNNISSTMWSDAINNDNHE